MGDQGRSTGVGGERRADPVTGLWSGASARERRPSLLTSLVDIGLAAILDS